MRLLKIISIFFLFSIILFSCKDLDQIKQQNEDLKKQLVELNSSVAIILEELNNLKTTQNQFNTKLNDLYFQLDTILTKISVLNEVINSSNSNLDEIKKALSELEEKCSILNEQIKVLINLNSNLKNGLVIYLPFNGNADDESGNKNNGTVLNAIKTSDRFGINNSAYQFDGFSTYIDINNKFFNNGWNNYTISIWFNSNSDIPSSGPGQCLLNTNPHRGLALSNSYKSSKKISFWNAVDYDWSIDEFNLNFDRKNGEWNHLIIVKNGLEFKFYLNGKFDSMVSHKNNPLSRFSSMRIGAITCCDLEVFNGKIDDIGIWNRSLNENEISFLFENYFNP